MKAKALIDAMLEHSEAEREARAIHKAERKAAWKDGRKYAKLGLQVDRYGKPIFTNAKDREEFFDRYNAPGGYVAPAAKKVETEDDVLEPREGSDFATYGALLKAGKEGTSLNKFINDNNLELVRTSPEFSAKLAQAKRIGNIEDINLLKSYNGRFFYVIDKGSHKPVALVSDKDIPNEYEGVAGTHTTLGKCGLRIVDLSKGGNTGFISKLDSEICSAFGEKDTDYDPFDL